MIQSLAMAEKKRLREGVKRPRAPEKNPRPTGGLISISDEERARLRERREQLELDQEYVGNRIGVSAATIGNIETGRTKQPRRSIYFAYRTYLFRAERGQGETDLDANVKDLAAAIEQLDANGIDTVRLLAERLVKPG